MGAAGRMGVLWAGRVDTPWLEEIDTCGGPTLSTNSTPKVNLQPLLNLPSSLSLASQYMALSHIWLIHPPSPKILLWLNNNVCCVCVCVCFSQHQKKMLLPLVTQSCLILCDPMDYSPPGSTVRGIF